ncbi:hypothetical protein L596_022586 [Steinernema carpocapsae]|uniref:Inhibitor of growth protein n=1 Tax=Steinernema carpocapsae TaxID=34508 RepID=A0A4U5MM87_STECR|nr:hypothetical protein L596_022586 [Steinernema carpocapsae]
MEKIREVMDVIPPKFVEKLFALQKLDIEANKLVEEADSRSEEVYKNLPKRPTDKEVAEVTRLYHRASELSDQKLKITSELEDLIETGIANLSAEYKKYCHMILKDVKHYREILDAHLKREKEAEQITISYGRRSTNAADRHKSNWLQSHKEELPQIQEVIKQLRLDDRHIIPTMAQVNDNHAPKFCKCHKQSYGKMIQCEAAKCPYDWFHYECVGLTVEPSGEEPWYCNFCAARDGLVSGSSQGRPKRRKRGPYKKKKAAAHTKEVPLRLGSDRADRSGLQRMKPTGEGRQQRLRDTTDV